MRGTVRVNAPRARSLRRPRDRCFLLHGDLRVRGTFTGQADEQRFLRGQGVSRPGGAFAGMPRPLGESPGTGSDDVQLRPAFGDRSRVAGRLRPRCTSSSPMTAPRPWVTAS